MARRKIDKDIRQNIKEAQKIIQEVSKADGNEAETRRRIERIFSITMGYDTFKHVTREHAVQAMGGSEYCDYALFVEEGKTDKPKVMVEIKAVNIDLAQKHLKQVSSYAINKGCEWVLLTNGREWELHHVSFVQPPQVKLMEKWNLLNDEIADLVDKFYLVGYRNVKKGGLDERWSKMSVLDSENLIRILVSEESIKMIRRELKKVTDILVSPEEIVGAIRRLLNEDAIEEMESIKISLPPRQRRRRRRLSGETGQPNEHMRNSRDEEFDETNKLIEDNPT